ARRRSPPETGQSSWIAARRRCARSLALSFASWMSPLLLPSPSLSPLPLITQGRASDCLAVVQFLGQIAHDEPAPPDQVAQPQTALIGKALTRLIFQIGVHARAAKEAGEVQSTGRDLLAVRTAANLHIAFQDIGDERQRRVYREPQVAACAVGLQEGEAPYSP